VATVVSRAGGRVVLDAGSKVLGADRASYASGYGRLLDHPGARVTQLSEHHAVVAWDDSPPPALGSRVRVVPNHVCSAVNLADGLVLTDGDVWPVAARGANT
jgi:D-serine deaminase-like pyridoxal phosphate-dependent protein